MVGFIWNVSLSLDLKNLWGNRLTFSDIVCLHSYNEKRLKIFVLDMKCLNRFFNQKALQVKISWLWIVLRAKVSLKCRKTCKNSRKIGKNRYFARRSIIFFRDKCSLGRYLSYPRKNWKPFFVKKNSLISMLWPTEHPSP